MTTSHDGPAVTGTQPVEQYVAGLPRKRMAAGVLFRDSSDRVLVVEPSYKQYWEMPGGSVEADEAPWAATERELLEELGWNYRLGRLLVVDYVRPQDSRPEGVIFVFDGGVLTEGDLARMTLNANEIRSAGFYTLQELAGKMKPILIDRFTAALNAVREGGIVLCEQRRPIA
ncbi:NUDIX domain-containing protein [Nocardia sp. CA-107356]|uniref:NUDIX domain-containing protein n=1 Tax=Nocardia sp. CA-107356 TaxID=3239972 RepID=UPI003D8A083E